MKKLCIFIVLIIVLTSSCSKYEVEKIDKEPDRIVQIDVMKEEYTMASVIATVEGKSYIIIRDKMETSYDEYSFMFVCLNDDGEIIFNNYCDGYVTTGIEANNNIYLAVNHYSGDTKESKYTVIYVFDLSGNLIDSYKAPYISYNLYNHNGKIICYLDGDGTQYFWELGKSNEDIINNYGNILISSYNIDDTSMQLYSKPNGDFYADSTIIVNKQNSDMSNEVLDELSGTLLATSKKFSMNDSNYLAAYAYYIKNEYNNIEIEFSILENNGDSRNIGAFKDLVKEKKLENGIIKHVGIYGKEMHIIIEKPYTIDVSSLYYIKMDLNGNFIGMYDLNVKGEYVGIIKRDKEFTLLTMESEYGRDVDFIFTTLSSLDV